MRKYLVGLLIALGVIALTIEARTAFAQDMPNNEVRLAPEAAAPEAARCFAGEPARAQLASDGYARVGAGLGGAGVAMIEVWSNRGDGRFMIVTVGVPEDLVCVAAAGVNWQNYRAPP